MTEASEAVLGDGKICRVDAEIVRYPDRYMDENGHAMWSKIMHILKEVQSWPTRFPRNTYAVSTGPYLYLLYSYLKLTGVQKMNDASAAQRSKRDALCLKGPTTFGWIR